MTLNIVCIIVVSFIVGFVLGMNTALRIDLDTFDAQAHMIRELVIKLSKEKPDDPRYHQE